MIMSPGQSRIPTIRLWSRRLAWVLIFCLLTLPVLVAASLVMSWFAGAELYMWGARAMVLSQMEPSAALFMAVATAIAFLLFSIPLLYLHQMFSTWARGEVLTRKAAGAIKNAGLWIVIASVIVGLILPAVALGFSAWLGLEGLLLDFSIELDAGLVGGVIYVVGIVLDEAARVAEEAELTI
jgi:hypothetical protein